MLNLRNQMIFVALQSTDMRKSFDGLVALVKNSFSKNPLDGAYFVFINKSADRVKILYWDTDGYAAPVIATKRLSVRARPMKSVPCAKKSREQIRKSRDAVMEIRKTTELYFRHFSHCDVLLNRTKTRLLYDLYKEVIKPTSRKTNESKIIIQGQIQQTQTYSFTVIY